MTEQPKDYHEDDDWIYQEDSFHDEEKFSPLFNFFIWVFLIGCSWWFIVSVIARAIP